MDSNNTHKHITTKLFKLKRIKIYVCKATMIIGFVFMMAPTFAQGEYTVFKYDNGKVSSEGMMVDGRPDGYWKTYYPDGKLKSEGNRLDFELDSIWMFYNELGDLSTSISYKQGQKHGVHKIYKDGLLYEESIYENDIKSGEALLYYPTGEVKRRVTYVEGKESGEGFEYEIDGRIITLLSFRDGFLRTADQVNRYDNSGNKRGPWISFHPNGVLASEGYFMNGKKNGIFKTYDKRGNLLTLEKYRDGELVVDSEESVILDLRSTYYADGTIKSTGGYIDDLKEGTHRLYDQEGNIEGGELYSKGQKIGAGIIDENGDYQGLWKLFYPTGELQAEGEFEDTKRTGEWVFFHKSGEIEHKAKYLNGLPHGKWTWYYEDGKLRREEFFRRGKEDGTVTEYDNQGNIMVQGDYVNGLKDGSWFLNVGDHIEKGSYRDGERIGDWIYEYEDGTLNFEGEYAAGLAVGKHRWYHPDGQLLMEGKYSSGQRTGTWKKYDEEGVEVLNVKYKSGREVKINGKKVIKAEEYDIDL